MLPQRSKTAYSGEVYSLSSPYGTGFCSLVRLRFADTAHLTIQIVGLKTYGDNWSAAREDSCLYFFEGKRTSGRGEFPAFCLGCKYC